MSCFRRGVSAATSLAAVLACADCSGGGGGTSTPTPPPPVVVTRTFPANVAVAAGGGTAWDIIGVKTTLTGQFESGGGNLYDTLRVDVTFSQDVANALPLPGQPLSELNQLGISIGLDTDGNPNTGVYQTCDTASNLRPFEYASDQGNDPNRLADGNYTIIGPAGPIYTGASNPPAEAQTVVNGDLISQTFFLSSLGVNDKQLIPRIGIDVAAVNGSEAALTDCTPSDGSEIFTDGS